VKRFFCLLSFLVLPVSRATEVPVLTVADSINPGSGAYIVARIEDAEAAKAPYVILVLDTPGGLVSTTRTIVQKMLNSTVPVVVYVGPRGAHAGSAGALITFASDIAAMAPATNIGAAHPVAGGGEQMDKTMATKMANDLAAFAESVAKSRGRNTDWAVKAVRDSASIPSEVALKQGVIDLIADDLDALKAKLAGARLRVAKNGVGVLPSSDVTFTDRPMTLRYRAVSFFADPNLAYLIMSLGTLCIWIELSHPGLILPGVLGVLCVLLSLVSFQLLPISYGALALIFVGIGFVIAELFLPTYGILGVAGIAAFVFGSLFLMDTTSPEFQISLKLILPTAAVLAGSAAFIAFNLVKSLGRRSASGLEALIGEYAEVREPTSEQGGKVFVQGELWNAVSESGTEIPKGTVVVVKQVHQLKLVVAVKA
jgi:membrane-bound serine protease (ClpP class)